MNQVAAQSIVELRALFARGGYIRVPSIRRQKKEGGRRYKKGAEIRFVVSSLTELEHLRRQLDDAGLSPGRAFIKNKQWCQPVYGWDSLIRFLALLRDE